MFHHSVKVPRHYKIAANILKKVSTEGGSVKTLLYDDKLRHFRTNVLYALISEAIKHSAQIDRLFENTGLLTKEPRFDPWLAKILTTELLFGKKNLPGASKPEQTILSYKEQFYTLTTDQDSLKTEVVERPRYVRINTNLLTTSDAIRAFQDEGYRFVRCTSGSYNDYLEQIKGLTEEDFTQDYHVKTMFVFHAGTKFHEHELYLENKIILQDKATALAVHLLAPPAGSVVLDMCAAPGMKTTQLAAYMRNQGKIYAVEQNERRYKTLCEFVEKTGSTCVQPCNKDCLEIRRGSCEDVEYILLDPSCSGSGMSLSVHNYFEDERMAKLTSLQEKFLKHAMNGFPNAKKIVYSTCSLFPEENERVITNTVMASRTQWKVLDVKQLLKEQWNNFGSGMYGTIGTRCLYARPDSDCTTGFFLAVLERREKDPEKKPKKQDAVVETEDGEDSVEAAKKKKKKDKSSDNGEHEIDYTESVEDTIGPENGEVSKKKKKKKNKEPANDDEILNDGQGLEENIEEAAEQKVKKKKKRKHDTEEVIDQTIEETQELEETPIKKKKNKRKDLQEITESEDIEIADVPKKKKKKKKRVKEE